MAAETTPSIPAPSQTAQPASPSAHAEAPRSERAAEQERRTAADKGKPGGRGLPAPVAQALDAKKTVVILFWNTGGVDDRSVKSSVDQLSRRGGKVAVFTDKVANLSRYTRITAAASVTQTPSLVIVNREGPGRGPDRLLRLPDDPPVRAERRPPLSADLRARRPAGEGPARARSGEFLPDPSPAASGPPILGGCIPLSSI